MQIEQVKISEIKMYERNAKKHPDKQVEQIVKSIKEFGFNDPIAIDENNVIIEGHGRYLASKKLNIEELPCIRLAHLSDKQKKAYILAHNKLTLNTGYNEELLNLELMDILELNDLDDLDSPINMDDFGFDMTEYDKQNAEEDDYEIPDEIKTDIKQGDIFQIGEHRLMCGDSTKSEDVEKLMNGEKADIGFTSPPYNSGNADFTYDYKSKKEGGFYENYKDDLKAEEYFDFLISVLYNYSLSMNNDNHSLFWNVMYNANSRSDYGKIIFSEKNPFSVRETIIWNKITGFPIAGNNILSRNTELIFLLSNSEKYKTNQTNKTIYWNRWDVSSQGSQDSKNKHKACFPVGLPSKAIQDFSKKNNIILDLFLGSGSTMVACHQLNRRCYGMELDPKYCQVIIDRMQRLDPEIEIKKL